MVGTVPLNKELLTLFWNCPDKLNWNNRIQFWWTNFIVYKIKQINQAGVAELYGYVGRGQDSLGIGHLGCRLCRFWSCKVGVDCVSAGTPNDFMK